MNENKRDSVCAVVVTYNRRNLLLECLKALQKQTRPIQAIYLIDNASIDGTPELLLEKGYIKELPPKDLKEPWAKEFEIKNLTDENYIRLYYVRMCENTGGAGGFHEGVKRTYEKGYDWLWLMDDDVEPKSDCLENMFKYTSISKCIHPYKFYKDGSQFLWEQHLDIISGWVALLNDISFRNGKDYCYVNVGCFEGMLINRNIVGKIGFPDPRFFIALDDTTYGFLASLFTNVIYIKNAVMIKKLDNRWKLISYENIYYNVRNEFLKTCYLNKVFSRYKGIRYLTTLATTFKWLAYIVKHYRKGILKALKYLTKGLMDGMSGKFGKRI